MVSLTAFPPSLFPPSLFPPPSQDGRGKGVPQEGLPAEVKVQIQVRLQECATGLAAALVHVLTQCISVLYSTIRASPSGELKS